MEAYRGGVDTVGVCTVVILFVCHKYHGKHESTNNLCTLWRTWVVFTHCPCRSHHHTIMCHKYYVKHTPREYICTYNDMQVYKCYWNHFAPGVHWISFNNCTYVPTCEEARMHTRMSTCTSINKRIFSNLYRHAAAVWNCCICRSAAILQAGSTQRSVGHGLSLNKGVCANRTESGPGVTQHFP